MCSLETKCLICDTGQRKKKTIQLFRTLTIKAEMWNHKYSSQLHIHNYTHDNENLKLNCQHAQPSAQFPCPSVNDKPNWISFSISTLHRSVYRDDYKEFADERVNFLRGGNKSLSLSYFWSSRKEKLLTEVAF